MSTDFSKVDVSKFPDLSYTINLANSVASDMEERQRESFKAIESANKNARIQRHNIKRTADNTHKIIENLTKIEASIVTETDERKKSDDESRKLIADIEAKNSKKGRWQNVFNFIFGIIATVAAIFSIIAYFQSLAPKAAP